jgi:hypothetical protein
MRASVLLAGLSAAVLISGATNAWAAYVYAPDPIYATQEGNLNNVVFGHVDVRSQWVFSSALFGAAPLTINGFSLRFDSAYTNQYGDAGVFQQNNSFNVRMATIQGMASTNFGDNLANAVTVIHGAQSIPYNIGAPAGQIKPWGVTINFTTPYDYDPTLGRSLVLDMYTRGQDVFGTMDFVSNYARDPLPGDAAYRVFNNQSGASTGALQSYAPVIRFNIADPKVDTPPAGDPPPLVSGVPEPASWGLMILGLAGLGGALRRRRAGTGETGARALS